MKCNSIISALGLFLDIVGFSLISWSIIKPKKPKNDESISFEDAFGEPIVDDLITFKYFQNDTKAKIGFWLVILGFMCQLIGTLLG